MDNNTLHHGGLSFLSSSFNFPHVLISSLHRFPSTATLVAVENAEPNFIIPLISLISSVLIKPPAMIR